MSKPKKGQTWGGKRPNQTGRPKTRLLRTGERKRLVVIYATDAEMVIFAHLSPDMKKEALLHAAARIFPRE